MLTDHVRLGVSICDYKNIARRLGKLPEEVAACALTDRLAETLTCCAIFGDNVFTLVDAYNVTTLVVGLRELEDMLDELELREIMELKGTSDYILTQFGKQVASCLA